MLPFCYAAPHAGLEFNRAKIRGPDLMKSRTLLFIKLNRGVRLDDAWKACTLFRPNFLAQVGPLVSQVSLSGDHNIIFL